jgi:hypothetical protein
MSLRDDLPYLLSIPQYSSVAQTVATIGQQSDNHQIMESSVATMYIHPVGLVQLRKKRQSKLPKCKSESSVSWYHWSSLERQHHFTFPLRVVVIMIMMPQLRMNIVLWILQPIARLFQMVWWTSNNFTSKPTQ